MRHHGTTCFALILTLFVILAGSMLTSSGALGQPTNTTLVIGGVDSVNAIFDENKLNDALAKYIRPSPGQSLNDKIDAIENSGKSFLKGLGGMHTQAFLAAARGKVRENGKFNKGVHVQINMSGQLIKSEYSFTMENGCPNPPEKCGTLNKLVAITSIEIKKINVQTGAELPPAKHIEFRFELKSKSKGARVIHRNAGPSDELFGGVIPFNGAMVSRVYSLGLTQKLYVGAGELEIVEVKLRGWQTPPTNTPPAWSTIRGQSANQFRCKRRPALLPWTLHLAVDREYGLIKT